MGIAEFLFGKSVSSAKGDSKNNSNSEYKDVRPVDNFEKTKEKIAGDDNQPDETFASRGVRALAFLMKEDYINCYDLLTKSTLSLRAKDESMLSIACLCLGKYSEAIHYCTKLVSYSQQEWNTDRSLEKNCLLYANAADAFIKRVSQWEAKEIEKNNFIINSMSDSDRIQKIISRCKGDMDLAEESTIEIICNETSEVESELNHFILAESLFLDYEYKIAATAYLLTAKHNPQKAMYWGYFGQSKKRSISLAHITPDYIEALIATKKAIQLEPNEIQWRLNLINILIPLHLQSPIKCSLEIKSEYEIAQKLPNPEPGNKKALKELGLMINIL